MCWEHPEVCKHEAARWVPLLHLNRAPPAHPSPRCLLEPIDLHGRGAHKGWSLGDGLCLESHGLQHDQPLYGMPARSPSGEHCVRGAGQRRFLSILSWPPARAQQAEPSPSEMHSSPGTVSGRADAPVGPRPHQSTAAREPHACMGRNGLMPPTAQLLIEDQP